MVKWEVIFGVGSTKQQPDSLALLYGDIDEWCWPKGQSMVSCASPNDTAYYLYLHWPAPLLIDRDVYRMPDGSVCKGSGSGDPPVHTGQLLGSREKDLEL